MRKERALQYESEIEQVFWLIIVYSIKIRRRKGREEDEQKKEAEEREKRRG